MNELNILNRRETSFISLHSGLVFYCFRGQYTFHKAPESKYFSFAGHVVFMAIIRLCLCRPKEATDNMYTCGCAYVPTKLSS